MNVTDDLLARQEVAGTELLTSTVLVLTGARATVGAVPQKALYRRGSHATVYWQHGTGDER